MRNSAKIVDHDFISQDLHAKCIILVSLLSFKMRDQKDFGPDRMITFDVSIELEAESDPTMGEVFFAVELSAKPKSFMVSKGRSTEFSHACTISVQY